MKHIKFTCNQYELFNPNANKIPRKHLVTILDPNYELAIKFQHMDKESLKTDSKINRAFLELLYAFFEHLKDLGDDEIQVAHGKFLSLKNSIWILIGIKSRHWTAFDPFTNSIVEAIPGNLKSLSIWKSACKIDPSYVDVRDLSIL